MQKMFLIKNDETFDVAVRVFDEALHENINKIHFMARTAKHILILRVEFVAGWAQLFFRRLDHLPRFQIKRTFYNMG